MDWNSEMALKDRISRKLRVRDLHMIEAIATRGSMARAAMELGLSQPAVSKAIADLELDLGVAVFNRGAQGVQLTESGQVLLRRGRVILDELRHGLDEIADISDPTRGFVRVGVALAQSLFISAVIGRISRRHPRIRLSVTMTDPIRLVASLRDRKLDFAICRVQMAEGEPDLKGEALFRDRIDVVVAPNHPLARRQTLTLADLTEERWALAPPDTYLGGLVLKAFQAQSLPMPQAVVTTTSIQLRFDLMETAGFLTLAPRSMVIHPSRRRRLKALPVAFSDDAGPMGSVTLKGRQLPKAAGFVLEEARSVGRTLAILE
jgi:DNA-binding transcriptional LysR family regulator